MSFLKPWNRRHTLCAWMLAAVMAGAAVPKSPAATEVSEPDTFGNLYRCNPGPWGDLEYYYIYLEAPDRLVDHFVKPHSLSKWVFEELSEDRIRALFQNAGLPVALQQYLLDPKHVVREGSLLSVYPPLPDLLAMTPEQRSVIYRELAKSEHNEFHANPVYITSGNPDQWLGQSRLRPELREVIKKMCYMRGDVLCFSDLSAVLGMVKSDEEAHDLFKTMTRTRSLVLRLGVAGEKNLPGVIRYWSGTNRNKDISSIIMSAVETKGIDRLDCIHLLPALPRRYLYSYPPTELAILGRMPDCHWTSLNFFNFTPRAYYLDTRLASMHVIEKYDKVNPPYGFGDVMMFMTPEGNALHSCVYIADDIVYSKNGENMAAPWLLMKVGDVKRVYSHLGQTSIQGYRLKALTANGGG